MPSPSTSVPLGLGPAAVDDEALKSPGVPPPHRSLRPEGAASLTTPTAGSSPAPDGASSGSGSGLGGKRRDRPRVSAPAAAASPKGGELGSDGVGGSEVRFSGGCCGGGSSGGGTFVSFRSGSRIAKRPMEPNVQMSGEIGLGSDGGVGAGDQVLDEMLHRDVKGTTTWCKSILVGGIEMEYVTDSESDDDEDCILLSTRMPMQLCTAPNVIESNFVPMGTYSTDEGRINDPVQTGKEQIGEFSSRKKDLLNGESMHLHNSLEMSVDGMIKPLASPIGIPATGEVDEVYVDMYFKEEIRRYESRKGGRGKGKLVLENNNSGVSATVGVRGDARTRKFGPDDKGKGKMVVEESPLSRSSSDDEMVLEPVVSEEIQSI